MTKGMNYAKLRNILEFQILVYIIMINMRKLLALLLLLLLLSAMPAQAFWVWTPETNKWVNPKYAVKETPQEQLEYALDFFEMEDYAKSTRELQKLIRHYPKAREAADAQYYIALGLEKQEKYHKSFKEYQLAIQKYPFSERTAQIIENEYNIALAILDGREKRNKFIKTVVGGDYDVIEIFRAVIKNEPYGKYAAPAQYKIGLYLLEKQLFQEARDEFEKTMNDYPDSEWAQAARYRIALADSKRSADAAYNQKVTAAAIDEFEQFVRDNPGAELSGEAKSHIRTLREKEAENSFLVADFYEKQKKYKSARIYYSVIVDDYKDTSWASKSLERIRVLNELIEE